MSWVQVWAVSSASPGSAVQPEAVAATAVAPTWSEGLALPDADRVVTKPLPETVRVWLAPVLQAMSGVAPLTKGGGRSTRSAGAVALQAPGLGLETERA